MEKQATFTLRGARVRQLREAMQLDQAELGKRMGTSQARISAMENSNSDVTVSRAAKLALIFDVSIEYLVGLTDEKKPLQRSDLPFHKRELLEAIDAKRFDKVLQLLSLLVTQQQ